MARTSQIQNYTKAGGSMHVPPRIANNVYANARTQGQHQSPTTRRGQGGYQLHDRGDSMNLQPRGAGNADTKLHDRGDNMNLSPRGANNADAKLQKR